MTHLTGLQKWLKLTIINDLNKIQTKFKKINSKDNGYFGSVILKGHPDMDHVTICTCIEQPCATDTNRLEVKIFYD